MPLYVYSCVEHGQFERLHPKMDQESENCPKCGKPSEKQDFAPVSPFQWNCKPWNR